MIERTQRRGRIQAERRLWRKLRSFEGCRFLRHHPVGRHLADFVCMEKRVIVEVDDARDGEPRDPDAARTLDLEAMGYRVIRFWDHEVFENRKAVLEAIRLTLHEETVRDGAAVPTATSEPSHRTNAGVGRSIAADAVAHANPFAIAPAAPEHIWPPREARRG